MNNLKMYNKRVLVEPTQALKKVGSIWVPPVVKGETPTTGEVIAFAEDITIPLMPGDTVFFTRNAGVNLKVGEEDFLAMPCHEIIAVARKEA